MKQFEVLIDGNPVGLDTFVFNGGESHVAFKEASEEFSVESAEIKATIHTAQDAMTFFMLVDAVKRTFHPTTLGVFMPYLPYSRQDRVCNEGEALSLKVFCDIVNTLGIDVIATLDCHSDVGVALLDGGMNVVPEHAMARNKELVDLIEDENTVLISPDAGANKKVLSVAKAFGGKEVIRADKVRNTKDGSITGTEVYGDVDGRTCLIIDDICDGGFTFVLLASKLKLMGAKEVILYVTHGIFAKGVDVVLEGGVDYIFTTDYWPEGENENVTVIDLYS
ncbi:ribose-phosphate diphosphokinase [bacterium]|nr:ribose-phosphate diphosphokinase [bacterium]